jgi:mannose-6-phosphate isomerase-like protein (cupin superfamily)
MTKINLAEKFSLFDELWSPKVIGELNGQQVKIAKIQGEFVWHHHEDEDELFMVIKGQLTLRLRDADTQHPEDVHLEEGEIAIVPHGIEHKPVAEQEAHILMFEPVGTLNTGNVQNEKTIQEVKRI